METKDKTTSKQNVHANHRNRVKQKFVRFGLKPFAEHEILEMLLFYAIPQADTNPLAHRLIQEFGSLKEVLDAPIERLKTVKGVGDNSAILINFFSSLMHEYNQFQSKEKVVLDTQLMAKDFVKSIFAGVQVEQFYVICIGNQNEVLDMSELNSGSQNKVHIDIRELTNYVLQKKCERIIIAHNHPKGNPFPSDADINMTRKIFNSCVLNDIDILDHVIYSPYGMFSFAEEGFLLAIKETIVDALKFTTSKISSGKLKSDVKEYVIVKTDDKK